MMARNKIAAGTALALVLQTVPGLAQSTAPTQVAETTLEEIVVFGLGQVRQEQSLTAAALELEVPGTSPLKAIEKLPGVNFQSADPFGAYEWSTRIAIRGFNQNQLGFTLDGVPLGDMSYGNHNGLHISRAISSENVGLVTVAQGSGALGTASTSNLGGTLQFASRTPDDKFGAYIAGTGGESNTYRGFLRVDSGSLPSGTKGYVSYSHSDADKWKGDGVQKHQQVNGKLVQEIGAGTATAWFNWSDRKENDYQDLSLDMIRRLGVKWDNFTPDWATAVRVADIYQGTVTSPFPTPVMTVDDAYYDAAGLRKDKIGALTIDYPVGSMVELSATGYGHGNEGQGLWYTPYVPTPGGAPISIRTTEYEVERYGFLGNATARLANHTVNGGVWIEDNDFHQARRFYGLNRAAPQRSSTQFQRDPFFTQWEYRFNTKTRQFHLQDSWEIFDRLTVYGGFKSINVKNKVTTVTAASPINGTIELDETFLPQAGFLVRLTDDHELFASYTENVGAFVSAATAGPFSTSPAGFAAIRGTLKPESSRTFEGGWRFRFDRFQGSLAGYDVRFKDRLLAVTLGPGILGNPAALQNVGSVGSRGLEAAATLSLADSVSLFASYTYNDAEYRNNVLNATGGLVAATAGKTVVNSPKNLLRGEISYDDGNLFGSFAISHTGKRYYTYLNDSSVDSYSVAELTLGYRFSSDSSLLDGLTLQLNVTNLFDEEYVATIGSNGFVNSDPLGQFQTVLPGAPRQIFATLSKKF